MSLPFNNYDQLRCRGNEYVTDQTFNRSFYRFYRNDVYLDNTLTDHITNELIHNITNVKSSETQLSGDRMVILPCGEMKGENFEIFDPYADVFENVMNTGQGPQYGTYIRKGWQTLIDEQPKNLGGYTLTFRIQKTTGIDQNPTNLMVMRLRQILTFSGFYGGTLIIESPPAHAGETSIFGTDNTVQHDFSAVNQRICLMGGDTANNHFLPYTVSIERCKCKTIIRQCTICIDHINAVTSIDATPPSGDNVISGIIYRDNNGPDINSCMTLMNNEWTMMNVRRALNIEDCEDVLIRHCYIVY